MKIYPYVYKYHGLVDGEKVRSVTVYAETQDEAAVFARRRLEALGFKDCKPVFISQRTNPRAGKSS